MKRERARRIAGRIGLVLFGVTLALGVAEVGLRVVGFREERARRETVLDPLYGTVRADSWVFDFEIAEGAREVDLRGQRVAIQKEPGETRVLFIGDSGTEGVRLPLEETFPLVYERLLDEEQPRNGVRAINAGVFGMTTIDELHFLESELLPLDPDVVVLGLFMSNDINFNLAHEARVESVRPRAAFYAELADRSALAQFLFVQAIALNARWGLVGYDDLAEHSVIPHEIGLVDSYGLHALSYPLGEIATYEREPSAMIERAFETLAAALGRFVRLAETHRFRPVVLVIPTPSTVAGRLTLLHFPNIWPELAASGIRLRPSDLDFDAPTERLLDICAALDLTCIDPTPPMREAGLEVFFPDDEHPTERGHLLLARALGDGLQF